MTATDYRTAGYKVSLQLEQAIIDRHENTALNAYIYPILPNASLLDADVKGALMAISYLLMCYDNVFVTRAGAKGKTTPLNSDNKASETIMAENVEECARLIEVLKSKQGAVKDAKVNDVAKIYFKTNFFYN